MFKCDVYTRQRVMLLVEGNVHFSFLRRCRVYLFVFETLKEDLGVKRQLPPTMTLPSLRAR